MRVGVEAEHMLVTRRPDGSIAPFDPQGVDTLEKPCYDFKGLSANLGYLRDAGPRHGAAGLGALRVRPRGRHRPVRAQLEVRRRADDGRPLHVLQDDDEPGRGAARRDRDAHAQAVQRPDRQRLALPLLALEGRRERRSWRDREGDPRGLGQSKLAYHFLGGPADPRPGAGGASSRRRSTATSGSRSAPT